MEYEKLKNQKIVSPDSVSIVYSDNWTYNKKEQHICKIVSYLNGECGDCILSLVEWESFFMNNKSIFEDVGLYLYIYARDYTYLESLIVDLNIDLPLIYDLHNEFRTLNDIPEDSRFQTFLLDSMNNVLCIGNPTASNELKLVYLDKIRTQIKKMDNPD
ncbi:MAG: hypothetical protein K9J25_12840 [Bacteroidales bacterium]|nr:hypothetical protein [Bacteroidales bacterium]